MTVFPVLSIAVMVTFVGEPMRGFGGIVTIKPAATVLSGADSSTGRVVLVFSFSGAASSVT